MVARGTVVFSAALLMLIGSLFGAAIGILLIAAAVTFGELLAGVAGVILFGFSVAAFYILYDWFTEDV